MHRPQLLRCRHRLRRTNRQENSCKQNSRLLPSGPAMKHLDTQTFSDRLAAVARARRIFIPHITTSITLAFDIYQEILAEHERQLRLTTLSHGHQPPSVLDQLGRLNCFRCETPMALRILSNGKYHSQWECPRCGNKRRSKKTLNQWLEYLQKRFDKLATE